MPLKHRVAAHRASLAARALEPGHDGLLLSQHNAAFLQQILRETFESLHLTGAPVALVAVGSLGRGAVTACADVDVRLLTHSGHDVSALAESMLYPLWDAGLNVGHQVVSVDDLLALAPTDLSTATALLDVRHLAGEPALVQELLTRAYAGPFADANLGDFLRRLEDEVRVRHERFGDSVYLLEPDTKNGVGGARDFEIALWAAKARFRLRGGELDPLAELVQLGAMVPREQRSMHSARESLHRIRNHLHLAAGRRVDRLTFENQEELAPRLGFADSRDDADPRDVLGQAVERLMQHYYQEARTISQLRTLLLARLRPEPRRKQRPVRRALNAQLALWDEHVTLVEGVDCVDDPSVLLQALAACVRHEKPLWPHVRDLIVRLAQDEPLAARLRASAESGPLFVELTCSRADSPFSRSPLAEMHELGLLSAMVPEFVPVLGRVHHDLYHVYTVDVHSVAATDAVRAIARGELAGRWPLATRVFSELERPRALFLAALLHDVGKGYPDANGSRSNHCESGALLVQTIMPRLGEDATTTALVHKLVLEHLSMYHTATRRDLDDPSTIRDFAQRVGSREVLEQLFLLTLVDLSTTAPKALNTWKTNLLEELYLRTAEHFEGQSRPQHDLEALLRAMAGWPDAEIAAVSAFARSMPKRYRALFDVEQVAAHAALSASRSGPFACAMYPSELADTALLVVVADDSPGLLALVAAAITAGRLEVVAADVYSREGQHGSEAFDVFWVRDRTEGSAAARAALPRLVADLGALFEGEVNAEELLERRRESTVRRGPRVAAEVVLYDRAAPEHTVVEVFGRDRPGLLYALARCFTQLGLSIERSRINTEGNRVADVFYVQERATDAAPLARKIPPARFEEIRTALLGVVEPQRRV